MEWQERARRALARVLMAFVLMPAFAHAQVTISDGCFTTDNGSNLVNVTIPPSISFVEGKSMINGEWLYQSRSFEIKYRCFRSRPGTGRVGLQSLKDFGVLRSALRNAGLRMDIIVNGDVSNFWNPDPLISGGKTEYYFGDPYTRDSGEQTMTFVMLLTVSKQITSPLRVFLPPVTAFKLVNDFSGVVDPGVFIATTALRVQYVPRCIGDLVVDNVVSFDTVLTDANDRQLPQAKPFKVITRVNPACPNLDSLILPSEDPRNFFRLPLAVSFEPQGGERMGPLQQTIFLKNTDGKENGLKLRITNADGNNVQFGPLYVDQLGVPFSLSVNNIATELNNNTTVTQAYTAHLEREPTIRLSLGKYNSSVLVKASWY